LAFDTRVLPAPTDGDGLVFIYGGSAGTPSFATINGPSPPVTNAAPACDALQGGCVNPQGNNTNPQGGTSNPQGNNSNPQESSGGSGGQAPPPPPPPPTTEGFFVEDDIYGGTWARTDPNNGTWYAHGTPPSNGSYWYPNGLGVAVDCSESAAPYAVVVRGVHGTWSWWAHVTDGKWVPVVVFSTVWNDGQLPGLPVC
jgi:hypothetical protein